MEDGVLCFSVVQLDSSRTPEPRHILSRHSLPITDVHCGLMGPQARVATASLDQTVKVSFGQSLLIMKSNIYSNFLFYESVSVLKCFEGMAYSKIKNVVD